MTVFFLREVHLQGSKMHLHLISLKDKAPPMAGLCTEYPLMWGYALESSTNL